MPDKSGMNREQLVDRLRQLEAKATEDQLQQLLITAERKRDQSALRDSEERLRAILDTAVEGIITIDERGVMESINLAAQKIFGYRPEEVIGKNVSMLMPMPYKKDHDTYIANYRLTAQPRIIGIGREVVGLRKDGSVFPMDLSVSEVRLERGRIFAGFVRDITDRKRLEKEILEISERERRSIGHALHDGLSQHLAGIEMMSQVLQQSLAGKNKAAAAQAGKIAEHVREALVQTRMLARGLSPVSIESEGLMSALQELAASIRRMFRVDCHFECRDQVLVSDNVVATHVYRIAQEAINNAIKHGKATDIEVQLVHKLVNFQLVVADNGQGFPAEGKRNGGMGLQIMKYRAGIIEGALDIRPGDERGTKVVCTWKAR